MDLPVPVSLLCCLNSIDVAQQHDKPEYIHTIFCNMHITLKNLTSCNHDNQITVANATRVLLTSQWWMASMASKLLP